MLPTLELYNDAERNERARIRLGINERAQLFRLKGYLEGVGAPEEMQQPFNDLLDLAVGEGVEVGRAKVRP